MWSCSWLRKNRTHLRRRSKICFPRVGCHAPCFPIYPFSPASLDHTEPRHWCNVPGSFIDVKMHQKQTPKCRRNEAGRLDSSLAPHNRLNDCETRKQWNHDHLFEDVSSKFRVFFLLPFFLVDRIILLTIKQMHQNHDCNSLGFGRYRAMAPPTEMQLRRNLVSGSTVLPRRKSRFVLRKEINKKNIRISSWNHGNIPRNWRENAKSHEHVHDMLKAIARIFFLTAKKAKRGDHPNRIWVSGPCRCGPQQTRLHPAKPGGPGWYCWYTKPGEANWYSRDGTCSTRQGQWFQWYCNVQSNFSIC